MNIFSRLFRRQREQPVKADGNEPDFLRATADRRRYSPPDYSQPDNQLKAFQALSWVTIAVGAVADGCVAQKFNVMRLVGEETEQIDNHDFEQLLRKPNDLQTRYTFLFSIIANRALAGNAYIWMNRPTGGPPTEIYSLPPNRIRPIHGRQVGLVSHYEWDAGTGAPFIIPPDDVVHVMGYHPRDMFLGMSKTEPVAIQIEKDHKAQKYDLSFFADDNAKPDGILGIKGEIGKETWEEFKNYFKRRHGGTKRGMAYLRGLDGIDFVQLALNYLDMEFLPNRTFTKEEIFATFAPGLASVLAINATEANSQAGKATLAEYAVYPALVALQEAITNRILPLYDENLIGEFEDPRLPDRAMILQEIAEYSKYHTIDEVRSEFYQSEPLGDDRGELLVAQVKQGSMAALSGLGDDLGGFPPQLQPGTNGNDSEQTDSEQTDDRAAELAIRAKIIEVQPTPEQQIRDELRQWRRFEMRRVGKDNPRPFETEHIPDDLAERVRAALDRAKAHDDIEIIFAKAQEQADNPELQKLSWRFDPGDRMDSDYVPPITEADIQSARVMEALRQVVGEEDAQHLINAELGNDASD